MRTFNRIIPIAFYLLLGIALGWFIKGDQIEKIFTIYLPAMATLMAAYFGARYAFDLHSEKEKESLKQKNFTNGNLTIFNILRMINNLTNYQQQIINPIRGEKKNFVEMSPTLPSEKDKIELNIDQLSFLMETNDPNILGEISVAESKYQRAIDAIRERSRVHLAEAQPSLEEAGILEGGNYTFEQIEKALGNRLYTTLQQSTKQIIEHVDSTIINLYEIGNKLSQILEAIYPKEKIIRIAQPNQLDAEKP